MKLASFVFLLVMYQPLVAQQIKNEFFVFQSILSGDSNYADFEKQVKLIKETGFDGIEIFELNDFEDKLAAVQKHHFKPSFLYTRLDLDKTSLQPELITAIRKLKGLGTIICPYVITKKQTAPNLASNTIAVRLLRELASFAKENELEVAIYPHKNFYIERVDHAVQIAKEVDRENAGIAFNLCHWLATTDAEERNSLHEQLSNMSPYLKMMSINGANNVVSSKANIWQDYILPLGDGSFDTKALVRYVTIELGLSIPIGIQCYNIKGNKVDLVHKTMKYIQEMKSSR